MFFHIKKVLNIIFFNLSLFLLLMIGIQNSSEKRRVDFMLVETIELPISFIIGLSFITGSITSNLLTTNSSKVKEENS